LAERLVVALLGHGPLSGVRPSTPVGARKAAVLTELNANRTFEHVGCGPGSQWRLHGNRIERIEPTREPQGTEATTDPVSGDGATLGRASARVGGSRRRARAGAADVVTGQPELRVGEALLEALRPLVVELVEQELARRLDELGLCGGRLRWLTLEQAAARLGCSRDAVRMRVRRGRLEHRYQGRRLYVSADAVDRL
jgi:excisionase family DNA binding protein